MTRSTFWFVRGRETRQAVAGTTSGGIECNVVLLRYSAGLNDAEIADTLGVTHDTVRMHLSRAIDRLSSDVRKLRDVP